jgi:hypothetical protein
MPHRSLPLFPKLPIKVAFLTWKPIRFHSFFGIEKGKNLDGCLMELQGVIRLWNHNSGSYILGKIAQLFPVSVV